MLMLLMLLRLQLCSLSTSNIALPSPSAPQLGPNLALALIALEAKRRANTFAFAPATIRTPSGSHDVAEREKAGLELGARGSRQDGPRVRRRARIRYQDGGRVLPQRPCERLCRRVRLSDPRSTQCNEGTRNLRGVRGRLVVICKPERPAGSEAAPAGTRARALKQGEGGGERADNRGEVREDEVGAVPCECEEWGDREREEVGRWLCLRG
jgi:hypothetical protein